MTNDEIIEASLPTLTDSLYPESIVAAAERAREQMHAAKETLMRVLEDISLFRSEEKTPDRDSKLHGARCAARCTIVEIRFLRELRGRLLRVLRHIRPTVGGRKVLPLSQEGRAAHNKLTATRVQELSTALIPFLVPTLARSEPTQNKGRATAYATEHALAEEWLRNFPDIFFGFSIEPPLSIVGREKHPLSLELFDKITSILALSRNELLVLSKGLLG